MWSLKALRVVWKGDPQLPPNQQGLRVFVVPIGQPEFVHDFLTQKEENMPFLFKVFYSLYAPFHVRIIEGQPLFEDCQTRIDEGFHRSAMTLPYGGCGRKIGFICRKIAGFKVRKGSNSASHCEEKTHRHCRVDDQAFGGGTCPLFPGSPAVQKSDGCLFGSNCLFPSPESKPPTATPLAAESHQTIGNKVRV